MINPEFVEREGMQLEEEGCLSVPGFNATVVRPERVIVKGLDRHGADREHEGKGLLARAFQHEMDHLDGTLFVDRVEDPTTFATWEQYERFQRDEFAVRAAALVARFGS